jgi:hypothetical protein
MARNGDGRRTTQTEIGGVVAYRPPVASGGNALQPDRTQEVAGSSPASSTSKKACRSRLSSGGPTLREGRETFVG